MAMKRGGTLLWRIQEYMIINEVLQSFTKSQGALPTQVSCRVCAQVLSNHGQAEGQRATVFDTFPIPS
jgi:hypothetical protein